MNILNSSITCVKTDKQKRKVGIFAAFTLSDLLVVIAVLALLAVLPFSARGNAKTKSRQLYCVNNLRQLGVAMRMYVADYQSYPGCLYASRGLYVWPKRLLSETGMQRKIFCCPAAAPNSWWDTNLNKTIRAVIDENSLMDWFAITATTRFSLGYNDWGLGVNGKLGLGGDIDGSLSGAPMTDSKILAPSQMIALGDLPATQTGVIQFNADLDPIPVSGLPSCQRPSNRHNYRTDLLFADGHTETPFRNDVISPQGPWRSRWNNDNNPHTEVTWTISDADRLDP